MMRIEKLDLTNYTPDTTLSIQYQVDVNIQVDPYHSRCSLHEANDHDDALRGRHFALSDARDGDDVRVRRHAVCWDFHVWWAQKKEACADAVE